jgi:hypothetical protein
MWWGVRITAIFTFFDNSCDFATALIDRDKGKQSTRKHSIPVRNLLTQG